MLGKKIFAALVKNLLNGQFNAVANIVIYSIEFVIFWLYRPFRDNMVRVLSLRLVCINDCFLASRLIYA
jgi:hypothetical protein